MNGKAVINLVCVSDRKKARMIFVSEFNNEGENHRFLGKEFVCFFLWWLYRMTRVESGMIINKLVE
jgi:hypothetical protein